MLKMNTGSANLDSLIDSISRKDYYLFYGNNKAVPESLVHGLLVNCIPHRNMGSNQWFS